MDIVFTDLDGTLLDRNSYSWEAASPALEMLGSRSIPWILVTSKTRAEVEPLRLRLGHEHPFVVESGGAAFIPFGYFKLNTCGERRDSYHILEWGTPYQTLINDLRSCSQESQCRVRGFSDMAVHEVAELCALPLREAALSKSREYDEPFLVLDPDRADALNWAIQRRGRICTRGGRFWHILGANDKAIAVKMLSSLYQQTYGPIRTIGLGDAINDASFLNAVTVPVLVRSADTAELQSKVPSAFVTEYEGPRGWNQAILALTAGPQSFS